jgi:hypothetical protein
MPGVGRRSIIATIRASRDWQVVTCEVRATAACGAEEPDTDLTKRVTGADQEYCLDPVHSTTSENAVGGDVPRKTR